MTEPTTRIVVAIDIPGTPEQAYRELRANLRKGADIPDSWGWETTDEWFFDGEPLNEDYIQAITELVED